MLNYSLWIKLVVLLETQDFLFDPEFQITGKHFLLKTIVKSRMILSDVN